MTRRQQPALAIINNAQTPYRLHVHHRIASEMPEVELWSVFTHDMSNAPWQIPPNLKIRPIYFGNGESSIDQSKLARQMREWRKGRAIVKWLKEHDVRAVVLAGYNDLGRLHILSECRKSKIPCFLFGDSNILADNARGLRSYLKHLVVRHAVGLAAGVCYCGELGRQYFTKYGARPDAMFPFPYEPDYGLIERIQVAELTTIRAEFGLDEQRRYFVYSGRLAPEKRVDLLLEAFGKIAGKKPEWDLLIIGDGPLRQELSEMVPPSLRERLHWTGFLQDAETVSKLYRCADVLVLPSDYEPWGVVVSEAATCLALVCSSAVGAARELVRNGVNGRTFERGNLDALTAALLEVSNPETLESMKAKSPEVLNDWRKRADPVFHLRKALSRKLPLK